MSNGKESSEGYSCCSALRAGMDGKGTPSRNGCVEGTPGDGDAVLPLDDEGIRRDLSLT